MLMATDLKVFAMWCSCDMMENNKSMDWYQAGIEGPSQGVRNASFVEGTVGKVVW